MLEYLKRLTKKVLRELSELISNQTVYESGEIKIVVQDDVGEYSQKDHIKLCEFVHHELLSDTEDLSSLTYIIIEDRDYDGRSGSWTGRWVSQENSLSYFKAEIVLNYSYNLTLKDAKRTLAHEYGHHWTIFYCLKNHWNDHLASNQKKSFPRLPNSYYSLRGLSHNIYCHDYSKGWHFCDKEVMAEDYRTLFAPAPYNENHGIIEKLRGSELPMIPLPDINIKTYIKELK